MVTMREVRHCLTVFKIILCGGSDCFSNQFLATSASRQGREISRRFHGGRSRAKHEVNDVIILVGAPFVKRRNTRR